MRRRILGVGVALGALGLLPGGAVPAQTVEGDVRPDPEWTLRTLDGETFTLGELRGRPVFVNLWATWCPPCVAEMASIDRLAAAVGDGAVFLLVSPEDVAPVREFQRRQRLGVAPVLEETLAPEALGLEALPHTVILDASGRMRLRHRGAAEWDTPEMEAFLRSLIPEGPPGPHPAFHLASPATAGAPAWRLTALIPSGWRMYAPGAQDLGLPLAARWTTGEPESVPAAMEGPDPVEMETVAGLVQVHRGTVVFSVSPPPDGAHALEVSWALCRDDRCVQGWSTIRRPHDRPSPSPPQASASPGPDRPSTPRRRSPSAAPVHTRITPAREASPATV